MRTRLESAIRDESGKVFILVLALLVVGGLILGPVLGLMGTGLTAGQVYEKKTHELYAADAGIEDALWRMQESNLSGLQVPGQGICRTEGWEYPDPKKGDPYILTVNERVVNVTIKYEQHGEQDLFIITSIATCPETGSSTTVLSYVHGDYVSGVSEYEDRSGDITDGTWTVEDGLTVDGSINGTAVVYAKGDLQVEGNIEDDAEVYVEGSLTVGGNIEDDAHVYVKVDLTVNGNAAEGDVTLCVGRNLTINKIEDGAQVYVEGNLTASAIEGGPRVCVQGSITVGKIERKGEAIPIVCAGGEFTVTIEIEGGDIYADGHKPFADCPLCCADCHVCCECPPPPSGTPGGEVGNGGTGTGDNGQGSWEGWNVASYTINP